MATIGKKGDDRRHGAVRKRKQVYNSSIGRFVKIDEETGRFMDVKADDKPFAGVRGAGKKKAKKKTRKKAKKKAGRKKASRKKAGRKKVAKKRTTKKRGTRKKAAARR